MGINVPASEFINKGVIKGAIKVEMVVRVIDNATLALAKYAITLDAKPPGHEPIKIIPAAISVGKSNKEPSQNPKSGIMLN